MRRLLTIFTLIAGVFGMAACDFNDDGNVWDLYYDEMTGSITISYEVREPDEDEETGTVPVEYLYLELRHMESNDWVRAGELDDYYGEQVQVPVELEEFGDYEVRIIAEDEGGQTEVLLDEVTFWIEQPQFIYHFDAQFDEWSGVVRFNIGINENYLTMVDVAKSEDGGLSWESIINLPIEENQIMVNNLEYYEYEEGSYVYKLSVYRNDTMVEEWTTWGEIQVQYQQQNYEGDPAIWYVDTHYDVYSKSVNIWWDAYGDFDTARIEKSTDLTNWNLIGEVPRFGQSLNYYEEVDGHYYYRVTAVKDGTDAASFTTENTLEVRSDAILGNIYGWYDSSNRTINLDWDFIQEKVSIVLLERSVNGGLFEQIGEYGNLKKMHNDEDLAPGEYVYRVSVLDENNNVLDQMESDMFYVEAPNYMYHMNVWYDYNTGKVYLNYSADQSYINYVEFERSTDGGTTWELLTVNSETDEWGNMSYYYFELNEGDYTFRVSGYDFDNEFVGEVELGYNITIDFSYVDTTEPTTIHWVNAYSDIYSNKVDISWASQGVYHHHVVEKSTDMTNWEEIAVLPRSAMNFSYQETMDGNYYYRVTAIDDENNIVTSAETDFTVRVKQDAILGNIDLWFDWNKSEMVITLGLLSDTTYDLVLERRTEDGIYEVIAETTTNTKTFYDIIFTSGSYQYRATVYDGAIALDQLESRIDYVDVPNHMYHLNVWFNQSTGEVQFNFGLNHNRIRSYTIFKSEDGGLSWEPVLTETVLLTDGWYKDHTKYYEPNEGAYVYKMTGFDMYGNEVGSSYSQNEITVSYDNLILDGEPDITYIEANYNIFDKNVNIWWNSQGAYEYHIVEKSLDGITWEQVAQVPRLATFYQYHEEVDGDYYYRIHLIDDQMLIADTITTEDTIRVLEAAQISYFVGYWHDVNEIELNWDIIEDNVSLIRIERTNIDTMESVLIGEYGSLKRILYDTLTQSGTYVYTITLLDSDGNVIDSIESNEIGITVE